MIDFVSKNIRHWLIHQNVATFARHFNWLNGGLWRYPVKVRLAPGGESLVATGDDSGEVHFCRPERIMRYALGVRRCLDNLLAAYMLGKVPLRPGDWVVDCGANVGEVSFALQRLQDGLSVVTIEPERLEANCADLNVHGGRPLTVRKVLWKSDGVLQFHSAAATADSSLFEPPVPHKVTEVQAITLARLVAELGIPRIRLLKLEAEGAEPEILLGAEPVLNRIDYIAADLGPERGLAQEQTATPVINFLLARGFELVDMKFDRVVCLFRNTSLESSPIA